MPKLLAQNDKIFKSQSIIEAIEILLALTAGKDLKECTDFEICPILIHLKELERLSIEERNVFFNKKNKKWEYCNEVRVSILSFLTKKGIMLDDFVIESGKKITIRQLVLSRNFQKAFVSRFGPNFHRSRDLLKGGDEKVCSWTKYYCRLVEQKMFPKVGRRYSSDCHVDNIYIELYFKPIDGQPE